MMKNIEKRTDKAFGKRVFLLGRDKGGELLWLEEATWDCNWYWGFGYVERYTNTEEPSKSRDVSSHTHWESEVIGKHETYNTEKKCFCLSGEYIHHLNDNPQMTESVLTDRESWELAELMRTFYSLKESAEVFGRGGSHTATVPGECNIVQREAWAKEINEKMLPALFEKIYTILTPNGKN